MPRPKGKFKAKVPLFTPKAKLILRTTNKVTPFLDLIDQRSRRLYRVMCGKALPFQ